MKTGVFKETDQRIFDLTGKQNYEILMFDPSNTEDESFGVISNDCRTITLKGHHGMIFTMELIDETEAKGLKDAAENDKDPADAPPSHYTLRPGHVGKLVFISGAPGFGKSTTARRLMEKEVFVYYEGDCFLFHKNPYLPPGENSVIDALMAAKSLKGVPEERRDGVRNGGKEWAKVMKGEEDYNLETFYSLMCEDIIKERKRIGGDWVVAKAQTWNTVYLLHKQILRTLLYTALFEHFNVICGNILKFYTKFGKFTQALLVRLHIVPCLGCMVI